MVEQMRDECRLCCKLFPANTLVATPLITVYGNQFAWARLCPECRAKQLAIIDRAHIIWLVRTFNEWPTL